MKQIYVVLKNELNHLKTITLLTLSVLAFDFTYYFLSNAYERYLSITEETVFNDITFYFILIVGTFILPIYIFGYMQETTTMTHLSSLPIKRYQTFLGKYLAGIVGYFVPVCLYVLLVGLFTENFASFMKVLYPVLIYFMFYYSLGSLVALLSGTKQMMVWLSIILYVLPLATYIAVMLLFDTQVYGLEGLQLTESMICVLFPAIPLIQNSVTFMTLEAQPIIYYPLYALVTIVLCFVACQYRQHEYVGETIISKVGLWVIKDVVIIVGAWYVLFLIYAMLGYKFSSRIIFILSYGLMLWLINYIVHLIFHKKLTFKLILKNYIMTGILSLGIVLVGCYLIETYQPSSYKELKVAFIDDEAYYSSKDPQYLQAMEELHDIFIQHRQDAKEDNFYATSSLYLKYILANGDVVNRLYDYHYSWIEDWLMKYEDSSFLPEIMNQRYYALIEYLDDPHFNSFDIGEFTLKKNDMALFNACLKDEIQKELHHDISVFHYFKEQRLLDVNYSYVSLYKTNEQLDAIYENTVFPYIVGDALDRALYRYKEVKQIS